MKITPNLSSGALFGVNSVDKSNLFVALDDYSIEAFDISRLERGKMLSIKQNSKRITGLKTCPSTPDGYILYATSEDGSCNVYDLRAGISPLLNYTAENQRKLELTSLDVGFSGNILCLGTDVIKDKIDGNHSRLIFYDTRTRKSLACLQNVHTDTITSVTFNNLDNRQVLSSSQDGLCCISDISQNNDDDSLHTVVNLTDPLESSVFYGAKNESILSLSSSNNIYVHDIDTVKEQAIVVPPLFNDTTLQPHICLNPTQPEQGMNIVYSDSIGQATLYQANNNFLSALSAPFQINRQGINSMINVQQDELLATFSKNSVELLKLTI